ncbi:MULTISPECIES: phosphotransferase family protein [unclassified Fusibacter]|uniref:phosphotransferase family protein n=1 Tax=unclassified Fusibacter TaxID=2624464 RepID=UPI001011ABFA|nr:MULTISPECIES: aminoglycoside phosphotransferase family protein [unclassified Fusibacter]MCK8058455.1 aminoglycoside phosphotransferase family protein [Fusibacter sp. A2]NPE22777.1 aminoglycoside phosphotransferase family protein [Fusibacter sp. A1]RXV60333.1 aminoglycoside phosphotransferase family protein [Fusibacter sp. A1]
MHKFIDVIQTAVPELIIDSSKLIECGQNNYLLEVNGKWMFRFPKAPVNLEEDKLEYRILSVLTGQVSLPIPNPSYAQLTSHVEDSFYAYEKIDGQPLFQEAFNSLKDTTKIAQQLGTFLKTLHHPDTKEALSTLLPVINPKARWQDLYNRVRNHLFGYMNASTMAKVTEIFDSIIVEVSSAEFVPCVVHGDFGPSNILFDPLKEEVTGIIDFAEIHIGDPATDIASLVGKFGYTDAFIDELSKTYPKAQHYLKRAKWMTKTFALQEALYGSENNDERAFEAGMKEYI